MNWIRNLMIGAVIAAVTFGLTASAQESAARQVGTIKSVNGTGLMLTSDGGSEIRVLMQVTTRILRIAPGQTDLRNATPALFAELQPGDRILVRGAASADGKSLTAASIVLIKGADVEKKKESDLQDWEKRGVGGLVTAVDTAAGTVKITTGSRPVTVKTTKETTVRRYSPESVKFEDAVIAKLEDVKTGDQLRARGAHSADGSEIAAEEIVAGTFRNVSGLITVVDATAQTITVNDLATKKPVTVKFTAEAQLHKLPEMIAQGMAARLRMARGETGTNGTENVPQGMRAQQGARPQQGAASQFAARGGQRNAPDVHQLLSRMPTVALADLKKGDAVMVVTTQPPASPTLKAVTLLTGVEALLTASPDAGMLLSPWNMGGGGGEGGGGAPPQ